MAGENLHGGLLSGINPLKEPLSLLIIQTLIIIILCRLTQIVLKRLKQPTVISHILAGILIGPSALGQIPGFRENLFPDSSMPLLFVIANFGLVFYLFIVGLEIDLTLLVTRIRRSLLISVAGMVVPYMLSGGTVYLLWTIYLDDRVSFGTLFLFTGLALSITSFPVLVRIINEMRLFITPVGVQTVTAAAFDDAAAWILLGLVLGIVGSDSPIHTVYIILMAIAFVAAMFYFVKPMLERLVVTGVNNDGVVDHWVLAVIMIVLLSAAMVAHLIGVDLTLGGFVTGLCISRKHNFHLHITEKVEDFVEVIFLPIYFAYSGLRTDFTLLNDAVSWGMVLLLIATACMGKIFGCFCAARYIKIPWRESLAIGLLMNCKGLVELIALNWGLDFNVIDRKVFAIFILMSVVVTLMIMPLVSLIYPPNYYKKHLGKKDNEQSADSINLSIQNHFKPMFCLPSLAFTPTIMNITQLLHRQTARDSALKSPNDSNEQSNSSFEVHALRIVEVSERSSSLMKAAQLTQELDEDPILKVFRTFALANNYQYDQHISIAPTKTAPNEVCEIAAEHNINTLVVPWNNPKEQNHGAQQDLMGSSFLHHHRMVRNLLKMWNKSMAIVVDRGLIAAELTDNLRILVPFYGGPDDQEALKYALLMSDKDKVKIDVLHLLERSPDNVDHVHSQQHVVDGPEKEMLDVLLSRPNVNYEQVDYTSQVGKHPIIDRLAEKQYILAIFGRIGAKWARTMQSSPENYDFEATVRSNDLRSMSNVVFSSTNGHPEEQLTVRHLSPLNYTTDLHDAQGTVKSLRSLMRNNRSSALQPLQQSHVANQLSVDTIDVAVQDRQRSQFAYKAFSGTVFNVLGETGDMIYHYAPKTSLIAIRKVPFDNIIQAPPQQASQSPDDE
ncbi:hypothetical protein MP228_011954 [Amoeboaphelidium protococcarum]|nr:hypothetical protein MP228_011954 [Amoeboaphelidium protococcarum]